MNQFDQLITMFDSCLSLHVHVLLITLRKINTVEDPQISEEYCLHYIHGFTLKASFV